MSKNWLKTWVQKNPKETTDIASNAIDAISKINVNETLSQFNKMAEHRNRSKEIENERIRIENNFEINQDDLTKKHEKLDSVIKLNNLIIENGLNNNDISIIHQGLSANVSIAKDIINSLPNHNNNKFKDQKILGLGTDDTKYIDIT